MKGKEFLIDLVRISSILRIGAFNRKKVDMIEIQKVTGLSQARIITVLWVALNSDYRDEQLDMLCSTITFSDAAPPGMHPGEDLTVLVTNHYPPLSILSILANAEHKDLLAMHASPIGRIGLTNFVERQFSEMVELWVSSNLASAESIFISEYDEGSTYVVENSDGPPMPKGEYGQGSSNAVFQEGIGKVSHLPPEAVTILGHI